MRWFVVVPASPKNPLSPQTLTGKVF
jgi:hypothetical protein